MTLDLHEALSSRRWERRSDPFPHVVASNVFRPHVLAGLTDAFREVLARGTTDRWDGERFCRSASGYDALVVPFSPTLPCALHLFLSPEWHDRIARAVGVTATGDVDGGLHHHRAGSAAGWRHTDLSPGWFAGEVPPSRIRLSDGRRCDYASGAARARGVAPVERVRAAAMIFFLDNGPWSARDGGETGLFQGPGGVGAGPAAVIPPLDNSMVLFECTPFSYHAFLHNPRRPRNNVVLWLHRTKEDAAARFGARAIVPWRGRPTQVKTP